MSHEASNWVLRQRSRSCATQCLLLVIANAADPEGVAFGWWKSRDHWWPYLCERTRLSRGTLFKLLNELEDLGYFTRSEIKPDEGGRAQPVIQLHLNRTVIEPERPGEGDESPTETEQAARGDPVKPSQSPRETEFESPTATENAVASLPERPAESPRETASNVPLGNPIPPKSPPLPRRSALDEADGFAAFFGDYPDHQAMNRSSALRSFQELSSAEQQQAIKTVGFYARDIRKLKRRPVSPANWLKERRFTEYSSGLQSSAQGGPLRLAPEHSEGWKAWTNVAGLVFGGGRPHVPVSWASQGARGLWRPSEWPLGGEIWAKPLDVWIFVVAGTAQHGRWCERIHEMFNRLPVPARLSTLKPAKVISGSVATENRDVQGLLVPTEWPPPKGTGHKPKTERLSSEAELDEFAKTG